MILKINLLLLLMLGSCFQPLGCFRKIYFSGKMENSSLKTEKLNSMQGPLFFFFFF